MKYISIFSGIEAATVAWQPFRWKPIAFSEIDPFPSAVLQHHYPNIPNLGDITKIDWSPYVGAADIVVGGSPCQSFWACLVKCVTGVFIVVFPRLASGRRR